AGSEARQARWPRQPGAPGPRYAPEPAHHLAPPRAQLAPLPPHEFRAAVAHTPPSRARYPPFLRTAPIPRGTHQPEQIRAPLARLGGSQGRVVAEAARWALAQ